MNKILLRVYQSVLYRQSQEQDEKTIYIFNNTDYIFDIHKSLSLKPEVVNSLEDYKFKFNWKTKLGNIKEIDSVRLAVDILNRPYTYNLEDEEIIKRINERGFVIVYSYRKDAHYIIYRNAIDIYKESIKIDDRNYIGIKIN